MYKHVSPNASEQEKWDAYIKEVVLTVEGTAWIAAAEIERGKTILESLVPLDGLTQRKQEAVSSRTTNRASPILKDLEQSIAGIYRLY